MIEYRLPEVDQRKVTKIEINGGHRNNIGVLLSAISPLTICFKLIKWHFNTYLQEFDCLLAKILTCLPITLLAPQRAIESRSNLLW